MKGFLFLIWINNSQNENEENKKRKMSHQNYKLSYKKFISIDIILYNINFLNIN